MVTVETYTYDYEGSRTSKTTHKSNGEFEYIKYLNDNSSLTNVLAEIDSEGNVSAYYTIGADLISQERDGETYTYLYDGHGSVVGLADESGRVTDTYVYDAFGNLLKSTGSTANNYLYCGEQFDESTGLYYLRARYMDTVTGRFISQDSYQGDVNEPVSLHKYLYANSNPVTYSDPSGYSAFADHLTALKGQAELAIAEIAQNKTAMVIFRSIFGAISGAAFGFFDTITKNQYTNEELWYNVIIGAAFGFVVGFVGGFIVNRTIHMFLGGLGVLISGGAAASSFANGEYRQGGFRAAMTVISVILWWRTFAKDFKDWLGSLGKGDTSWYKSDGSTNYPPNNGEVAGTEQNITLQPGDKIGRYGAIGSMSSFVTKPGASPDQLSLPPNTDPNIYQEFIVVKPISETESAIIAPWGGSSGGGTQYNLPYTIQWLIDNGYIIPVGM